MGLGNGDAGAARIGQGKGVGVAGPDAHIPEAGAGGGDRELWLERLDSGAAQGDRGRRVQSIADQRNSARDAARAHRGKDHAESCLLPWPQL